MKNALKVMLPATLLFLAACGETEPANDTPDTNDQTTAQSEDDWTTIDYSDMTLYDFSEDKVDLPFKMMLPLKTAGDKPQISRPEDVTWQVKLDDNFNVVIDDWGTEEKTVASIIEEAKSVGVYEVEVHEEGSNNVVYILSVGGDDDSAPVQFAHFCLIKKVNDTYYTVKSDRMGTFSVARAKRMLKAAKSFQPAGA